MDELRNNLTYSAEVNGKRFTFKRPTAAQVVKADALAAQLRMNVPVGAMSYGFALSDYIANLNTMVIEPKEFDFGELYPDEIYPLYDEVAKWVESFRKPVERK